MLAITFHLMKYATLSKVSITLCMLKVSVKNICSLVIYAVLVIYDTEGFSILEETISIGCTRHITFKDNIKRI